jgi:hypothetical protein
VRKTFGANQLLLSLLLQQIRRRRYRGYILLILRPRRSEVSLRSQTYCKPQNKTNTTFLLYQSLKLQDPRLERHLIAVVQAWKFFHIPYRQGHISLALPLQTLEGPIPRLAHNNKRFIPTLERLLR